MSAFNNCPYCGSDDIMITDNRPENDEAGDMVCQDMTCRGCKGDWTIEYRPVRWFAYEKGKFDETPRPLPGKSQ